MPTRSPRCFSRLVLCAGALLLAGCKLGSLRQPTSDEDWLAAHEESLSDQIRRHDWRWKNGTINGHSASDYALSRTALLLAGMEELLIEHEGATDQAFFETGGVGRAVPITSDGYFLTAAHCIERRPITLVTSTDDGSCPIDARVVWAGNKEIFDLALLHAPLVVPVAPLAEATALSAGRRVLTVATHFPEGERYNLRFGLSGGKIEEVTPMQTYRGLHWRSFEHDAPIIRGDSGGPVFDHTGKLLGINTSTVLVRWTDTWRRFLPPVFSVQAMWIDPECLLRLIDQDRRWRLAQMRRKSR